jgi:hypothetical protein
MAEIISIILGLLSQILPLVGVNSNLDGLIVALGTAITSLVTGLVTKQPVQSTVLTTLQATVTALEADTSLDPTVRADLSEGLSVLKAGIAGWQAADLDTDPSTLTPLPEMI